jgi:hypothetical protein
MENKQTFGLHTLALPATMVLLTYALLGEIGYERPENGPNGCTLHSLPTVWSSLLALLAVCAFIWLVSRVANQSSGRLWAKRVILYSTSTAAVGAVLAQVYLWARSEFSGSCGFYWACTDCGSSWVAYLVPVAVYSAVAAGLSLPVGFLARRLAGQK